MHFIDRTGAEWFGVWLKGVGMAYIMMTFLIKTVHKHFGFKTENTMIRSFLQINTGMLHFHGQ